MRIHILFFSFLCFNYLSVGGCSPAKVCSEKDRSCSVEAQILSFFSVPSGIYVYSTSSTFRGNLAAYGSSFDASLQNLCTNDRLLAPIIDLTCQNVRPFVSSLNSSTESSYPVNMHTSNYALPTTIPVRGPNATVIANSWFEFVDPNISLSTSLVSTIFDAGLGSGDFWTFSDTTGGYSESTCADGTDNTSEFTGTSGSSESKGAGWISQGTTTSCDSSLRILCVCYHPATTAEEFQ